MILFIHVNFGFGMGRITYSIILFRKWNFLISNKQNLKFIWKNFLSIKSFYFISSKYAITKTYVVCNVINIFLFHWKIFSFCIRAIQKNCILGNTQWINLLSNWKCQLQFCRQFCWANEKKKVSYRTFTLNGLNIFENMLVFYAFVIVQS